MKFPRLALFWALLFSIATLMAAPVSALAQNGSFDQQWAELLKKAQQEGKLVAFICCGIGRGIGKHIGAFEKKYKIKVVFSTGSSRQQADRVLAERRAGRHSLDVWMGGITTANTRLLPAQVIEPIKPLLIHPEVLKKDAWYNGTGPVLMDPDKNYIVGFRGNGGFASEITYNIDKVKPEDINSFWDLLEPRFRGKIVARDPSSAGVGQSTAMYYLHPQLGPEYLRRLLTETDITIVKNARQAAEWLALGKYSVCMFACSREVRSLMRQGMPVKDELAKILKEAPRISVGGGAIWSMKDSPNPNARTFFINWWLTREGQLLMQKADGDDSLRVDIPNDGVAKSSLRVKGVDYWFPEQTANFQEKLGESMDFARKALVSVGKK
ncbi:MAG: extracellular solute-binding protein [Deltaproteobacteria bacterium]|nr:extracellular solute-binding protein [Deltaproteobacteria bacterium]